MSAWWPNGLGRYLLRHPAGAWTLAIAGWRLRRNDWWRQAPFLPLPDPAYWKFRVITANGSAKFDLTPRALLDAAKWSQRQRVGK